MEHGPFEDVFPIENGDIPLLCKFTRGYHQPNHPGCLFDDLSIWELYVGMHVVLHYTWPSGESCSMELPKPVGKMVGVVWDRGPLIINP